MRCNVNAPVRGRLQQPLCRRYSVAVLSTAWMRWQGATGDRPLGICWALGSLINGEVEVLGAWLHSGEGAVVPPAVFGEMHARGAEFIRFGVGHLAGADAAFCQTFRHSEVVPSVAQALESVAALVPPRHRLAVSGALRVVAEAVDLAAARAALARFQCADLGERYPAVVRLWGQDLARFEPIYALHAQLRGLVCAADWAAAGVRECLTRAIHRHGPFADPAAALEFVASTLLRAERRLDREREVASAARKAGAPASEAVLPELGGIAGFPTLA